MKRIVTLFLLGILLSAFSASAAGEFPYHICLCYWYTQNVGPLPEPEIRTLALWDVTEAGIEKWNVPGKSKPTKEQLQVIKTQALAWYANREKEKTADFAKWDDKRLEVMMKVMLEEINALRKQLNMPVYTEQQMIQKMNAKLAE